MALTQHFFGHGVDDDGAEAPSRPLVEARGPGEGDGAAHEGGVVFRREGVDRPRESESSVHLFSLSKFLNFDPSLLFFACFRAQARTLTLL